MLSNGTVLKFLLQFSKVKDGASYGITHAMQSQLKNHILLLPFDTRLFQTKAHVIFDFMNFRIQNNMRQLVSTNEENAE